MIKKLATVSMDNKDLKYIKSTKETLEGIKRYEEGFYKYGFIDGEKKGMEEGMEKGMEKGIEKGIEEEKKRNEKIIKKAELQVSVFRYYFNDKKTVDEIAKIIGKTKDYIKNIIGLVNYEL